MAQSGRDWNGNAGSSAIRFLLLSAIRYSSNEHALNGLRKWAFEYAEAEPLYKQALAIREKALGPEHPDVAQSLENYSALLRKTGRSDEAAILEARGMTLRAKHAKEDPQRKGFLDRLFGR